MKCPICKSDLVYGTVEIRSTLSDWFLFGMSNQRLFLMGKDGEKKEIATPDNPNAVLECEKCHAVVIPNQEVPLPLKDGECQRCGLVDKVEKPYCRGCGQRLA
jgi:hypothetical protein